MVQDQEKQNITDKAEKKQNKKKHKTVQRIQLWQDIQDLKTN